MRVSVIIPCFKAKSCLTRALESILGQSIVSAQQVEIEVVIAADDHEDYSFAQLLYPKTVIIPPLTGYSGTGPGATRNRGIAGSSGDVLAFLDADDAWSENYLEEMLPFVLKRGAAFAPTAIFDSAGNAVITLGKSLKTLTPLDFGRWPGSFHPCLYRELSPGFTDGAGQDVFHAIEVLGRLGGRAPMAHEGRYHLYLQGGSVTANPQFSRKIDKRYRQFINAYRTGNSALSGMAKIKAMQALARRMMWNQRWLAQKHHDHGFYGFVAEKISNRENYN